MEDRKIATGGLFEKLAGRIARTADFSFLKSLVPWAGEEQPAQPGAPRRRTQEEPDYADSPALPIGPEITAYVSLDHMFGHAPMIRSLAQDQDVFAMQFERYEAAPCALAEEHALSLVEGHALSTVEGPAPSPVEGIAATRKK
jgi:translation elongation factor EF-G